MRTRVGTTAWICVALLGTPGVAQDAADPPDAQQAQPADQPADQPAVQPAAELPEAIRTLLLGATEPGRSGAGVLAVEGSVLPERAGLIRRTPYGEWAFVFMGEDGQPAAIVLLPCRQLERMVESLDASEASAVRLTGRLTVYDNTNYMLPTNYSIIASERETSSENQDPAAAADEQAVNPLDRIDPSLRAIAEDLEAGRIRARSLQAPPMTPPSVRKASDGSPTGGAGSPDDAIETDSLQEGDQLLRRRARLERQRGLWTLRFDDGQTDATDNALVPIIVLPNEALQSMEQSVRRYGDQIAFEVSGTVHRFGRQPYVLISMHFVQPLEGLRPRG